MDLEPHRLAGQRVVEIEQQPTLADLAHHAGVGALPVGRGELHDIAHAVFSVGIPQLGQQRAAHALQQLHVSLAEGLTGGQVEAGPGALGQADQARIDGRGKLPAAQRQRRRLAVEGVDDSLPVGPAEAVVQGQEGTQAHARDVDSGSDRQNGYTAGRQGVGDHGIRLQGALQRGISRGEARQPTRR